MWGDKRQGRWKWVPNRGCCFPHSPYVCLLRRNILSCAGECHSNSLNFCLFSFSRSLAELLCTSYVDVGVSVLVTQQQLSVCRFSLEMYVLCDHLARPHEYVHWEELRGCISSASTFPLGLFCQRPWLMSPSSVFSSLITRNIHNDSSFWVLQNLSYLSKHNSLSTNSSYRIDGPTHERAPQSHQSRQAWDLILYRILFGGSDERRKWCHVGTSAGPAGSELFALIDYQVVSANGWYELWRICQPQRKKWIVTYA